MTVNTFIVDDDGGVSEGDQAAIEDWRKHRRGIIWIDLSHEPPDVEINLLESFNIHPLAIQDALRVRHPPKFEAFEGFALVLLRGIDAKSTDIEFGVIQLAVFFGPDFLITRHRGESVSVNWMVEAIRSKEIDTGQGTSYLAIRLINRLARRYLDILLALEPRLDEMEELIFESGNDRLLSELTAYKSRLRKISRIAKYHLGVVRSMRQVFQLGDELEHELNDVYEQLERTDSLAELYYTMATDLVDGYLAYTSHKLNRVMQILTVITVIFVPLTFLAGIYGMNFENMPELGSRYGYFVVLAAMLVTSLVLLILFKVKKWI